MGLMPTMPVSAAGWRIEPPVSVPTAPRQRPAATAAAEPPDEPPGTSLVSEPLRRHGDTTGPKNEVSFDEPMANSSIDTLPTSTAPASRSLRVGVPSYGGTQPSRILLPAVVSSPSVTKRSLSATGTPASSPGSSPRAIFSSTESSAFGPVRNPWDPTRVPGGSSGGSAAAVAARLCAGALGTDTGGSIRQPAALCGVTGLKPTYGRVSRHGVIAFASSLDQPGPLARSAADCALLLSAIAGGDPHDATALDAPVPDYLRACENPIRNLTIGIPNEYFKQTPSHISGPVLNAVSQLQKMGAKTVDIALPHTDYGIAAYYLIATAEASSNLARYDGVRYGQRADAESLLEMYRRTRGEGFGTEVKRRIMLGTYALRSGYYDAYYRKAQEVRASSSSNSESK